MSLSFGFLEHGFELNSIVFQPSDTLSKRLSAPADGPSADPHALCCVQWGSARPSSADSEGAV
jgi:hypothetical protein